jgi:ankyrin repeat protein
MDKDKLKAKEQRERRRMDKKATSKKEIDDLSWELLGAAAAGDVEKVAELVKKGAKGDKKRDAATALALAMESERAAELAALLLPVSNANAACNLGQTALMRAADWGRADAIKLLLPHSDAKAKDRFGATAMIRAAATGRLDCVQALLEKSDLAAADDEGETALVWALKAYIEADPEKRKKLDAVVEFLAPKMDCAVRDKFSNLTLTVAARVSSGRAVRALLPFCDPWARSKDDRTALMAAAMMDNGEAVEALLATADTERKLDNAATAEKLAKESASESALQAFTRWHAQRERDALAAVAQGAAEAARAHEAGESATAPAIRRPKAL